MGIKIHHGPDGTFKTSGAIKDDILPVIKNGRTLVTNIRGFSRKKAVKVLGRKKVHKDFNVIFVDTENKAGREKLARFFHWAPVGAFFVIDEVQRVFKPQWTQKDLTLLNYAGGEEKAAEDNRPEDIHTAWDMQRHYNWDFVFTTTSITKVRKEMSDMAKIAIRHYNIGLWRFYKTVEHASDNRGTTKSSQGTTKWFNFVPSKIFALYSSTKTDTFTNSEPRTPFYRDPKVLGLLVALGLFWSWLFNKPVPKALGGDSVVSVEEAQAIGEISADTKDLTLASESVTNTTVNTADSNVVNKQFYQDDAIESFISISNITGHTRVYDRLVNPIDSSKYVEFSTAVYTFEAFFNEQELSFSSVDLEERGYSVEWVNRCVAKVSRNNATKYVHCGTSNFVKKSFSEDEDIEMIEEQS